MGRLYDTGVRRGRVAGQDKEVEPLHTGREESGSQGSSAAKPGKRGLAVAVVDLDSATSRVGSAVSWPQHPGRSLHSAPLSLPTPSRTVEWRNPA